VVPFDGNRADTTSRPSASRTSRRASSRRSDPAPDRGPTNRPRRWVVPFGVPFRRIALRNANAAPSHGTDVWHGSGRRAPASRGVHTIAGRVVVPARGRRTITLTRPGFGAVFAVPVSTW